MCVCMMSMICQYMKKYLCTILKYYLGLDHKEKPLQLLMIMSLSFLPRFSTAPSEDLESTAKQHFPPMLLSFGSIGKFKSGNLIMIIIHITPIYILLD